MAIIQAEIIDQKDLIQEVELLPGYGESWVVMRAETLDGAEVEEGRLVPGVSESWVVMRAETLDVAEVEEGRLVPGGSVGSSPAVLEAEIFGLRRR